ncbi:MAG: hypothetical protein GY779_04400 [Gammaproteobacteria bacterium]|nr:hypothetical protein [Gammaproteobacteria bacterium]
MSLSYIEFDSDAGGNGVSGTDALAMAFERGAIEPGLIVHSDRGVQYRSQR